MASGPPPGRPPPPATSPDPCPIVAVTPLTRGEWEVSKKDLWVDSANRSIYLTGNRDTPLETHLYVVSLDSPVSSLRRLTDLGFSHSITMDPSCSMFVSVYSSISMPPACHLFGINGSSTTHGSLPHMDHYQTYNVGLKKWQPKCQLPLDNPDMLGKLRHTEDIGQANQPNSNHLATLMPPVELPVDYQPPHVFSYSSTRSGKEQFGLFYPPATSTPGEKSPTVLFVYGGPQVQLVTNTFKGLRFLRLHSMASLGFAVLVLDVRGSCHRGLEFEGHLKFQMGSVEIEDHVEGLHYAATSLPEARDVVDLSRVAIHGWSYGGYLSLMGLAQRPDVFKVALAGAPVTSWEAYDTGYTERYMGQTDENAAGFQRGSVIQRVNDFPDEENRLLIIHGLIDENVHFRHTSLIINALIKACKPYQLQIYPNERHGIRQPDTSEHYETSILSFLLQHL